MAVRTKVYGFLGVVILLIVGGYFLNQQFNSDDNAAQANSGGAAGEKKADDESVPVELVKATKGEISSFLTSTANLRPLRLVDVAARGDGIVQRIFVEEGDYVKEGHVLCQLDDSQLQIRLQSAQQRLAQAKIQLEKSRIRQEKAVAEIRNTKEDLSRLQKLLDDSLVSEREVAQVRYRIEALEHDERVSSSETRELTHRVEELEAEIEQINLEISRTRVQAPFSGHVIERHIELGQTVRSLDSVFRIGEFSPLYADVHLSEADARRVHPGQSATIILGANDSSRASGRVERISPVVDQATGTVKVTVESNQTGGAFKPGAFVRVGIQTDMRTEAILIPKRAVLEEDGEKFVFVADGEKVKRTKVNVGYESDGQIEIVSGVSDGQQVVIAGQGGLKDGSKIKIVENRSQNKYDARAASR